MADAIPGAAVTCWPALTPAAPVCSLLLVTDRPGFVQAGLGWACQRRPGPACRSVVAAVNWWPPQQRGEPACTKGQPSTLATRPAVQAISDASDHRQELHAGRWGRQCRPSCCSALACPATALLVRDVPRWSFQVVVVIVYCGAVCAFAATTRVQAGQLRVAATLLACSTVAELVHRHKQARIGHGYAIWDLPGAVVLPPLYALLSPVLRMVLPRVRACRAQPDRCARTAADGLGYAVASETFHVLAPVLGAAGTGTGWRVMLWTVLVAGCGLLGRTAYNGLVLAAGKDAAAGKRLLARDRRRSGTSERGGVVAGHAGGSRRGAQHARRRVRGAAGDLAPAQRALRRGGSRRRQDRAAERQDLAPRGGRRDRASRRAPAPRSRWASSTSTTSSR